MTVVAVGALVTSQADIAIILCSGAVERFAPSRGVRHVGPVAGAAQGSPMAEGAALTSCQRGGAVLRKPVIRLV